MYEEMMLLVSRFAEYLRTSKQQLQCFHKYESQVEGWFKGELLCFLEQEKLAGHLSNFEREKQVYKVDEKYILVDMVLQFESGSKWVELKHWIGYQKQQNWSPSWYFANLAKPDVEKLLTIPDGDKFMLVSFTPNPGSKDWNSGVEKFNTKFSPPAVCSLTNPGDYYFYFLGGKRNRAAEH